MTKDWIFGLMDWFQIKRFLRVLRAKPPLRFPNIRIKNLEKYKSLGLIELSHLSHSEKPTPANRGRRNTMNNNDFDENSLVEAATSPQKNSRWMPGQSAKAKAFLNDSVKLYNRILVLVLPSHTPHSPSFNCRDLWTLNSESSNRFNAGRAVYGPGFASNPLRLRAFA